MPNATSKLVLAFVSLLIGVVLLGQVASTATDSTTTDVTYNEFVNVNTAGNGTGVNASVTLGPLANLGDTNDDCLMTGYTFANSSGTNLTETTHYVFDASEATFTLTNDSFPFLWGDDVTAGNGTNVTYTYCPSGYVNLAWGRTALNLTPGFFAIALLLISVGLFYSVYRDYKIDM